MRLFQLCRRFAASLLLIAICDKDMLYEGLSGIINLM